ncbi:MAG: hypothetical protein HY303_14660 [Candidatus Wallbacteria bacterium]|nr:hypothetical protein [Candidatus Wallbacteria bacterium]
MLAIAAWAVVVSVAAAIPGAWPRVPAPVWPIVSAVALGLAVFCARNLSIWSRALERTLEALKDKQPFELPDCGDPLFSRLFDACLELAKAAGSRRMLSGLADRASPEALDQLSTANLRWSNGWARCELPLLATEPMAEDSGLSDTAGLRASVTAQLEALKSAGAILDGYRWGEISAFLPPGPRAAASACSAALACRDAASDGPPFTVAVSMASVSIGELVEGGLTVLGPEAALARMLVKSARMLGASVLASDATFRAAGPHFRWRRLGKFRLGWRKFEVHEILGRATDPAGTEGDLGAGYSDALAALEKRDWQAASELFKKCLQLAPKDGPSRVCLNFSQRFRNNPPPRSWDGTLVLGPEP